MDERSRPGSTRRAGAPRARGSARLGGVALAVAALVVGAVAARPAPPAPEPVPIAAEACPVSATLVNPCRPWLGVVADHYPGLSTWRQQYEAHEQRIGKQVDVVHGYKAAGRVWLTADERHVVQRGSILYLNWKPANRWRDATGTSAAVDAQIDTMAREIRGLGDARVMLSIFGEPERFTTPGTSGCPRLKGSSGSPQEYRAMWAHVQDRFDALGVTNVVWVMNYLGYAGWDCLFPELWPGNDRVDWIVWDPYVGPGQRWDDEIGYFYDALEAKADATHDYTSKPWGLAEYGSWRGASQAEAYRMYDDARAALDAGRYPRLKLYEVYDTVHHGLDVRVGYTAAGVPDPKEQARYNAFAHHPAFDGGGSPPPPPPPPPTDSTDHLAGCDTSVEGGLSCFAGTYRAPVWPQMQTGGYHGAKSARITNTTGSAGTFGINTLSAPVASTSPGTTYSGKVWVKASHVGMRITLLLRERRADRSAPPGGYEAVSWVATHRTWHPLEAGYTAKEAGNELTFSVSATAMEPAQWFRADAFALTSTAPG